MSYIILNGKDSRTITGLIISTLPPITKPQVRTSIEEIDGRDGDIVTTLGYSAYDKEFDIGLSFGYDVDEVIDYFNSEGIVTFSNESDKYYKYQIYEQIDFEKLLRFKTATIKMHIQPFKFSLLEHDYTNYSGGSYSEFSIRNSGNVYSKPTIKIKLETATSKLKISLNNEEAIILDCSEDTTIIINVDDMNIYKENGDYANRKVVGGETDNLILKVGKNTIKLEDEINSTNDYVTTISNYSRWL